MNRKIASSRRGRASHHSILMGALIATAAPHAALAATIYSNDFETNSAGFINAGALPALTRISLPTDGGGLASPNQSTWLGRIGDGISEIAANQQIVRRTITGLVPGQVYTVAFDLLIGASWDGAAAGYGPDSWYFSVNGVRLVDTCFSNGDQGIDYGAYAPQRYSDTNYATPIGPDVPAYTGTEFFKKQGPGYAGYYGIYYFSHGAGNPVLTFVATGSTALLEWNRYNGGSGGGAWIDEYWALDNVIVTGTPAPCPGDINGDGTTNALDFNILASNFRQSVNPGTSGDLNGDGVVNASDFNILASDFRCHS